MNHQFWQVFKFLATFYILSLQVFYRGGCTRNPLGWVLEEGCAGGDGIISFWKCYCSSSKQEVYLRAHFPSFLCAGKLKKKFKKKRKRKEK